MQAGLFVLVVASRLCLDLLEHILGVDHDDRGDQSADSHSLLGLLTREELQSKIMLVSERKKGANIDVTHGYI